MKLFILLASLAIAITSPVPDDHNPFDAIVPAPATECIICYRYFMGCINASRFFNMTLRNYLYNNGD